MIRITVRTREGARLLSTSKTLFARSYHAPALGSVVGASWASLPNPRSKRSSEVATVRRLLSSSSGRPPETETEPSSTVPPAPTSSSGEESVVVRSLPPSLRPYARLVRLDKPIGAALLLWPCLWSAALAAPPGCLPDVRTMGAFVVGAFAMRGAGCVVNDLRDRDVDARVARTRDRPLASGELTVAQAHGCLAVHSAVGLGALIALPAAPAHAPFTYALCVSSLPLVAAYPSAKRYTNYPQVVLGLTFNWGALVGWAATHGELCLPVVTPLYLSGVCWTVLYDTLYAHQDKRDDAAIGLKSTALTFGDAGTKPILHVLSVAALAGWTAAGAAAGISHPLVYHAGCLAAWAHLNWQVRTADLDDPANLADRFRSNNTVGAIVFASCAAGTALSGDVDAATATAIVG